MTDFETLADRLNLNPVGRGRRIRVCGSAALEATSSVACDQLLQRPQLVLVEVNPR